MDLYLLRHALSLSPPELALRAWRKVTARAWQRVQRRRDAATPSYDLGFRGGPLGAYLAAPDTLALPKFGRVLARLCPLILDHCFDLLGSGWVRVFHGMSCQGLMGHVYPAVPPPEDLCGRVNEANRKESLRIRRLLAEKDPTYLPIDWSLDFKSGYRWPEDRWHMDAAIGPAPGVDIKVPWELARMQHLPRLALAHAYARDGTPGFERPERYSLEFRSQVLDFVAANPPRFGVNWRCAMDVAIRAANILAARDLFVASGVAFDPAFEAILARSAFEHGRHVAENLEWAEEGRGNHYLADLTGLLFIAARLPGSPLADAWLALAVREFVHEVELQFLPDGGSFEASTGYHRLSAQMVVYGAAQILALGADRKRALSRYDHRFFPGPPRIAPAPVPLFPLPERFLSQDSSPLSPGFFDRLARMTQFASHMTRPDRTAVQIGDNDSGFFFHFQPVLDTSPDAPPGENLLDFRHLAAAADGLLGGDSLAAFTGPGWLECDLVAAMAPCSFGAARREPEAERLRIGSPGELASLAAAIEALPTDRMRRTEVSLPSGALHGLATAAYPDFGAYVLSSPRLYLGLRCAALDTTRPLGHSHDDNLGLELWLDGIGLVTDPGSYVYTPLLRERDAYRSAAAHFVPRAVGAPAADLTSDPFVLRPLAKGRCVYFREDGFYGTLRGRDWTVARAVLLGEQALVILDGVLEGDRPLAPHTATLAVTRGYGKKTHDPSCLL